MICVTSSSSGSLKEMNEEPKITSVVKTEKNPGRVAAGKRLAAISKEAKERKKLEAMKKSEDNDGNNNNIIVGGILLAVAGAVTYFLWNKQGQHEKVTIEEEPKPKTKRKVLFLTQCLQKTII